jgi:HAD superfamily hydrolase (TIGR01509 family)
MKNPNLVIFDMDGLLFDTERPSFKAMKKSMEKYGFSYSLEMYKKMIGLSGPQCEDVLKNDFGSDFTFKPISDDYDVEFRKIINEEGIVLKQGATKLLDKLDKRKIKRCIASSSSCETIQYYLSLSGLSDRFDFYISGEEVKQGKPYPDIFLEACKRAKVTPESSLVLEDSLNGLRAAVGANINCIIVPDLIEPNEEMKKFAYLIVSNLKQVADIL